MGYNDFMEAQYHCKFMISDSGTAHEEPADGLYNMETIREPSHVSSN